LSKDIYSRSEGETATSVMPSLLDFGLTPLQERIFITLTGSNGLSTSQVSKITAVHRSDVYRALRKLVETGLVEVIVGNPSRYFAIEPVKAVRLLLDEKRGELVSLESKTDALTEWLENQRNKQQQQQVSSGAAEDETATFRLVKGNAVTPKVIASIQSAEREIIKVVSAPALRRHFIEFSEYESEASARGVTVRMLSEITPQNYRVAKNYSECVHLKHVANLGRSLRYLVIDGSELVLAGTVEFKDELDRSVLSTRNEVLVRGCVSYFEEMWAKALSFQERSRVISNSSNSNGQKKSSSSSDNL